MPSGHSSPSHCKNCGAALDPTILDGACPVCLWSDLISGGDENTRPLDDTPDIEGYDVFEELGSGGMGVVYRAQQHNPAREVALKIVAPYSLRATQARERFMLEIDAMAAVEHPALLPLYDSGEDLHGRPWFTMQMAHGGTLAERIGTYSQDWKSIANLVITLAGAVQYAHERGILHRDLKPANILFDEQDNPYIADFGLAKWADEDGSITRTSYLLGSPAYLAPEAAVGGSKVTTTVSDVYGLGAILYELLCGKKPYEGTQAAEILTQILDHPPASPRAKLPGIPRDLETIVMKAMAREPEKRYHAAAALADDLNRWLNGKAILARPVGPLERCWLWAKRNPAPATLTLLLAASLATGGILLWQSNKKLAASLDDAEARVEFMTRELPAQLEPLGRLDLLDSVFENVAEHYEGNHRTDAESMARRADFLTQWAQVLRPRGMTKAAVARLESAVEKAEAATRGSGYPVEAARARVSAGRRLGEVLIEDGQLDRARSTLADTRAFAAKAGALHPDDPRLSALVADLILEDAILELSAGKPEQALTKGSEAVEIWRRIAPLLEKNTDTPGNQASLVNAALAHYFLAQIHQRLGQASQEDAEWKEYLKMAEHHVRTFPANLHFRREYVVARQFYVNNRRASAPLSRDEELALRTEAEADAVLCMTQAPGNVRLRLDAAATAHDLARFTRSERNHDEELHWLALCSQRLEPLNKLHITDVSYLLAQRNFTVFCGVAYIRHDWEKARRHLDAAVRVHIKICQLSRRLEHHRSLNKSAGKVSGYIQSHGGNAAAAAWLRDLAEQCKVAAAGAARPALWKWSLASIHTRIAGMQTDTADARASSRGALTLLLSAAGDRDDIPGLRNDVLSAAEMLLDPASATAAVRAGIITELVNALPRLRQAPDPTLDDAWLDFIIKHTRRLPGTLRQPLVRKTLEQFFPSGDGEDPRFLELKKSL